MLSLDTLSLLPEQSHRPGNLWEILNSMRILSVGGYSDYIKLQSDASDCYKWSIFKFHPVL